MSQCSLLSVIFEAKPAFKFFMRKYLFITVLFFWFSQTFSQNYTLERRKDSLKLDSLKRALPALKGKEKIDALNKQVKCFPVSMDLADLFTGLIQ